MGEDPGCSALGRDWFRFNGNIQEKGQKIVYFIRLHAIIADKREASCYKYTYIYDKRRIVLCLTAGAMLYVVVEELVPEYSQGKHSNIGTVGFALGFALMMVLDVVLS